MQKEYKMGGIQMENQRTMHDKKVYHIRYRYIYIYKGKMYVMWYEQILSKSKGNDGITKQNKEEGRPSTK